MFSAAARALVACASQVDLDLGRVFPPLTKIREISARVASSVVEEAYRTGLARVPRPADTLEFVTSQMWEPRYPDYVVSPR